MREQVEDVDRPAADIDRLPAWLNADLIEKPIGRWRILLGLGKQPVALSGGAT